EIVPCRGTGSLPVGQLGRPTQRRKIGVLSIRSNGRPSGPEVHHNRDHGEDCDRNYHEHDRVSAPLLADSPTQQCPPEPHLVSQISLSETLGHLLNTTQRGIGYREGGLALFGPEKAFRAGICPPGACFSMF